MDIKDIAKEIRTILKNAFPCTKFSVTISRFSQGSAVDTSWTDGPTTDEVDTLINMYGNGRSQFIETNRKHGAELINKAIAVWKEQNPEYAHLTVTCEGEVSCHAKFSVSEFKLGVLDLHFYETSLNKIIRGVSEFDLSALYLKMHRRPKAVSVSELAPQPELEPSQPELVEVLTGTTPQPQPSQLNALEADALEAERKQAYAQYTVSWQEMDALEAKLTAKKKESKELGEKLEEIKAKIESKRLEKVRAIAPPKVNEITLTRAEGPNSECKEPVIKYWAVEIDDWNDNELVFGEEMTSVQALAEVSKGIVRESLRAPVEITKGQYLKEIEYRNS